MKTLLTDYRISIEEENTLKNLNFNILKVPPCKNLYTAVCGHPDMLLNIVEDNTIVLHKDIDKNFSDYLSSKYKNVIFSSKSLSNNYPDDIMLNALNLTEIFLHLLKYTDANLLNLVSNKKMINIKQGYSKCSTAIINHNAIITSDTGIAKALYTEKLDVLLLPPGDILLPGLDYGFIGGCCGLVEDNLLAFYGNLQFYKYGYEVISFLKKHKVEPLFLRNGKLIDRGSIFKL
ncbi:DUF6873 family GME fold protein [Clostridium omnivorum]|uniref:DUF6873 domain-containing protein n=1 Tax=Clostridium omnivorum TaxID=1604902 RepID=A0ABQ5N0J1_9CLOT|nr:hypothetical protein [Clostridium sp. E14]GLC28717.1 hypothetical protein bsdE14_01270 [Clostridium sp. E14]